MAQVAVMPEAPAGLGPSWRIMSALGPDPLANACAEQASYPTTPSSLAWGSSHAELEACQDVAWLVPVRTDAADLGLGQLQAPLAPASPLPQDLRAAGTMCMAQSGTCKGLAWDMEVSAPPTHQQQQQQPPELAALLQSLEPLSTSMPLQQQLLSLQLQGAGGIAGHLYDDAVQPLERTGVTGAAASLEQQQQQQQLVVLAGDGVCTTPTPLQLVRRFSDGGSSVASSSHHTQRSLPMGSAPAPVTAAGRCRGTGEEPLHTCGRSAAPVLQVVVPNDCSAAPSPATPHQLVCLSDGTLLAVSAPTSTQPALASTQQLVLQQQQQQGLVHGGAPTYIMVPPNGSAQQPSAPAVVALPPGGLLQGGWGPGGATLVTLASPGHASCGGAQPAPSNWQQRSPASRVSNSSSGSSDDSMATTVLVCGDVSMAAAALMQQQQQAVQVAAPITPQGFGGLVSTTGGLVLAPCSSPAVLAALQPTSCSAVTWPADPPGLEGCGGQPQQQAQPARPGAAAGGSGRAAVSTPPPQPPPANKGSPAGSPPTSQRPPRSDAVAPPGSRPLRFGAGPAAVLGGCAWGELLVARGALVVLLEVTWGVLTWTHFGAWAASVRQLLTKGGKKHGPSAAFERPACPRALLNHTTSWSGGSKGGSVEVNSHQLLQLLHTWRSAVWTLTHAVPGSSTAVPDQACPTAHPQHVLCAEDGSMLFSSPWDVASAACPLPLARTLNCYPPRHSRLGQPAPPGAGDGCLVGGLRWEALPQCYKTTRLLCQPLARNVLPELAGLMAAGALPKEPELLQASAAQWWALAESARRQVTELGLVRPQA